MRKVLNIRLDRKLYKYLKSQSMSTREFVTKAITEYLSKLECKIETKVYGVYAGLQSYKIADKYPNRHVKKWMKF